jgi:hypothetical protein
MTATIALDYKQLANAIIANSSSVIDPLTYHPEVAAEDCAARVLAANGRTLMVGPYEVRPGLNQEVPIGRAYQPMRENSISRLAGYLKRDEFGLTIREVQDDPVNGFRPSRTGIWVKQPGDAEFRRLVPGEGTRITRYSDVRIGGDGKDGATGLQVLVVD